MGNEEAGAWPAVTACPCSQVDVHIMMQPPSGEWLYLDTLVTNSSGRVSYTIPETHRLGVGVYPIKMVVRYAPPRGGRTGPASGGQDEGLGLVLTSCPRRPGETTRLLTATSLCCPRARSLWSSALTAPLLPACPSWAATPRCGPGPWTWCGEWPRGAVRLSQGGWAQQQEAPAGQAREHLVAPD